MSVNRIPAFLRKQQDFTSSGLWVCPGGVYSADFLVIGAGGAGGGSSGQLITNYVGAGGGGGGSVKKVSIATTPGTTYTITIGAKGTSTIGGAGTSGGYSEVVASAVTLIRSLGGGGGSGVISGAKNNSAFSQTLSGGGGTASLTSAVQSWGGAGGGTAISGTNSSISSIKQSDPLARQDLRALMVMEPAAVVVLLLTQANQIPADLI